MIFKTIKSHTLGAKILIAMAVLSALAAGASLAFDLRITATVAIICSAVSAFLVLRLIARMRHHTDYLINSTLNADFSYEFPTSNVSDIEREINTSLNKVVAHLERLSRNARDHERFLGTILNIVDTGIIVADEDGNVIHANKATLSLLSTPVLTHLRQVPERAQHLIVAKKTADLKGQKLVIYTINDLTRSLQSTEVESWEKLTRVLTHEIMNSLTPINSIAESLISTSDDSEPDTEDFRQKAMIISSSSHALMRFINNFRRFNIVPEPTPQIFYLKPFIEKAVSLVQAPLADAKPDFSVMVFPPDAMAYTDESLLHQVMVNILKNAIESSPTSIEVNARVRDDESIEISVSNDGLPIPDNLASQIFTPFFTTKREGSGIGLSLSRRIINKLGGTLTLDNRPNTKFTIVI